MRRSFGIGRLAALYAAALAGGSSFSTAAYADVYAGNGDTGFGGPIGLASLELTDDGFTLSGNLTRGTNNLNDVLVLYVDSVAGGFTDTNSFTDTGDGHRRAVSGKDDFAGNSVLTFPSGFEPDYAISLSQFYAGGWELVAAGAHDVTANGNVSPNGVNNAANYTFSMPLSAIGIAPGTGQSVTLLGTYISETSFRSTEAIAGNVSNAQGQGWVPFTGTATDTFVSTTLPYVWLGGTGTWSDTANWTNAVVPDDAGAHARIDNGNPFTGSSVTLDQDATVGQITVNSGESLAIDATRTLTIAGPGNSTVNGTLTNSGSVSVTGGTTSIVNGIKGSGTLSIGDGAKVVIPSAGPDTFDPPATVPSGSNDTGSNVTELTINGSGQLDLNNSDMVIDHDGSLDIADIRDLIASGYNFGGQDGPGIISTTAALTDPFTFTLGYADNASLPIPFGTTIGLGTLFSGFDPDDTAALIKFTWVGDVTLDGIFDFQDLSIFNGNYDAGATTGRVWTDGDLNFDGTIDFQDLSLFNGTYDPSKPSLPEPAVGSALALFAWAVSGTRRRRRGA